MNAAILHDHRVACLPVQPFAIVHVVPLALEHEENGAVHVAVFLTAPPGGEYVHVRLDGLCDFYGVGVDDALVEILWSAPPLPVPDLVHARLREQLVHEGAVGTFEGAHERPFSAPALPDDSLCHGCTPGGLTSRRR